jgi:HPr kinase/phosphorylase
MTPRREVITTGRLLGEGRVATLKLQVVAGANGQDAPITNPRVQKPGLALAGFLPSVKPGRVQVLGATEAGFLRSLPDAVRQERCALLVSTAPPLVVVCKGMTDLAELLAPAAEAAGVPLALTAATTSTVIERLSSSLEMLLAEKETWHGDLLDIFAIGVLVLGDSGSGKSECALDLVHRGHRLIADDVVEVFRLRNDVLFGQAPEAVRGLMEVRGLGLISIEQLFGAVVVRDTKPIDIIVKLVPEPSGPIDRLGLVESTVEILGLQRPLLSLPVAPGRNLALLVEVAARKYLLTQRGVPDAAREYLLRHDQGLERQ